MKRRADSWIQSYKSRFWKIEKWNDITFIQRGKVKSLFFSDLSLFKAHNKIKRYKLVNSSTPRQINHKPHQKWHQLVWRDYSEHQSKTLPSFWWPFLAKELSKGHFRGVAQNQIYKIIMAFIFHSRANLRHFYHNSRHFTLILDFLFSV